PSGIVSGLPFALDHLIQRCLAKNPAQRWHSTRDLWLELESVRESGSPLAAAVAAKPRQRVWMASAVLAVLLIASLIPVVLYYRSPAPAAPEMRFEIPAAGLIVGQQSSVSPDGHRLAYVGFAVDDSGAHVQARATIWIRPLNSFHAQNLPGTDGAVFPDWSPDGRFIVFNTRDRKLKKIEVMGGAAQTLTDLPGSAGLGRATWNREGTIIFATDVLYRVPASGGTAQAVTILDKSLEEIGHGTPWFLPDGRHFLYLALSTKPQNTAIYVGSLDSKNRVRLMTA